ncbi:MAG TPA: hypothetical protein VHV28_10205 [Solirubrobacteraceae bacterium]|nr:hypothetical protein [Solirubrobacteraceae bacterium]
MWRELGRTAVARRALLTYALAAMAALALCANALAAGKAVAVGSPLTDNPPSAAVSSSGDALIAWNNDKGVAGATNFVQYCVLPVGATACSHSGSLSPADGATNIDGVHVLVDGGTMVILADVFGAQGNNAADYTPEQEWQSTDGGATWTLVNGGLSVATGIIDADTGPLSAVIVPGTNVLGFGWDTAGSSAPTFNAFPLVGPPECSVATCPAGFATLEPATNPDQIGNPFGQFAAEAGAQPGVLGVFDTNFTNGPLGCPVQFSFGTAYVYGSGNQSASNSYNISPGSPGSAWKVPVTQADCNVENPGVGGGPSGFGVLETNEANSTTAYHRFNATTMAFDTPLVTVATQSELDAALAQDGAGGIYGTYLLDGAGGPINLSYSADGGKSFASGVLQADTDGHDANVTNGVNGAGQGWVAWTNNGSVFAQSFQAADAVSPATVSSGATDNGSTVTLNVTCASFPCTITITLTAPETVVVSAHTAAVAAKKGRKKTKIVTLGKGRFTITKGGAKKLAVKLSGAGKKLLAAKHGHIKIGAAISETVEKHTSLTKRTLNLTIKPPKKKTKK